MSRDPPAAQPYFVAPHRTAAWVTSSMAREVEIVAAREEQARRCPSTCMRGRLRAREHPHPSVACRGRESRRASRARRVSRALVPSASLGKGEATAPSARLVGAPRAPRSRASAARRRPGIAERFGADRVGHGRVAGDIGVADRAAQRVAFDLEARRRESCSYVSFDRVAASSSGSPRRRASSPGRGPAPAASAGGPRGLPATRISARGFTRRMRHSARSAALGRERAVVHHLVALDRDQEVHGDRRHLELAQAERHLDQMSALVSPMPTIRPLHGSMPHFLRGLRASATRSP